MATEDEQCLTRAAAAGVARERARLASDCLTGLLRTAPDARVAYLELPATDTAPFWGRWQARIVLGWWGVSPESAENVVLLVSEMVTNARRACETDTSLSLDYNLTGSQVISLTLTDLGNSVRLEVGDSSTQPPTLCDSGPDAESGRGLVLVDAISSEWSFFYPETGGKIVYAVVNIASTRDAERKIRMDGL